MTRGRPEYIGPATAKNGGRKKACFYLPSQRRLPVPVAVVSSGAAAPAETRIRLEDVRCGANIMPCGQNGAGNIRTLAHIFADQKERALAL